MNAVPGRRGLHGVHHLRVCLITLGLTGMSCVGSQILDPTYAEGSPRLPSGVGAWSAKELLPETHVIDGHSNALNRLNLLSASTLCPHMPMPARTHRDNTGRWEAGRTSWWSGVFCCA